MLRYKLRTLLIVLALAPLVLAGLWMQPRLAIAWLAFGPYLAFMGWQLQLRKAT
jgi:hypothetical protein